MLGIRVPDETPRAAAVPGAWGSRQLPAPARADVRRKLREKGVGDRSSATASSACWRRAGVLDPEQEMRKLHQQATLRPGGGEERTRAFRAWTAPVLRSCPA